MKIKEGYKLRRVCDSAIVVAVGNAVADFNGLVTLNETGEKLWTILENGASKQQLIDALVQEYSIEPSLAIADTKDFISQLKGAGLIES
ncbi:MAG TPA: PqqD family protein [Clostridia bacterium]|nr:PqqD family protein [Clostridia bacterium]